MHLDITSAVNHCVKLAKSENANRTVENSTGGKSTLFACGLEQMANSLALPCLTPCLF